MAIFEWKSEYDTGVEEIDNQHKVLVSLINELNSLVNDQFDRDAAGEVFKKLKSYTFFHFSTEESLMAQYHYEEQDLHSHLLQHRQFEQEIESVQHDFSQISYDDCNVILTYLTNWLIKHICKVDQRLADLIIRKRHEALGQKVPSETLDTALVECAGEGVVGGHDSTENIKGGIDEAHWIRYLALAKNHANSSDGLLSELEECMSALKEASEEHSTRAISTVQIQATDDGHSHCVQGLYLVKLLQSQQTKLIEILDIIEQGRL